MSANLLAAPDRRRAALASIGWRSLALLTPVALAVAFFALPLVGLLHRAPWSDLWEQVISPEVRSALRLSVVCSLGATAISVALGIPLAWTLARIDFPGRSLVRALSTLPMVLPPVVGGVALLFAFGRRGFAGRLIEQTLGVTLPFSTAGVILAEAFVAMPFLVVTTEAGLRSVNRRFEDAAATLGASPWLTAWRVTLPLVAPSLVAGTVLAWARALGEFGATITFAGNLPGVTQTMPLAAYLLLETRPEAAIIVSLILLAVSLTVLILLRERWYSVQ
ncbi:MAG: ABC transporter permease [Actinomycetota bacterium]